MLGYYMYISRVGIQIWDFSGSSLFTEIYLKIESVKDPVYNRLDIVCIFAGYKHITLDSTVFLCIYSSVVNLI